MWSVWVRESYAIPYAQVSFTCKVNVYDQTSAFVLTDGYPYVDTGLILEADHVAELAGWLVREIAHAAERQFTRTNKRRRLWSLLSGSLVYVGGPQEFVQFFEKPYVKEKRTCNLLARTFTCRRLIEDDIRTTACGKVGVVAKRHSRISGSGSPLDALDSKGRGCTFGLSICKHLPGRLSTSATSMGARPNADSAWASHRSCLMRGGREDA